MSSPRLPLEIVSTSIFSRLPSFIAEPLPKARSICASAASRAFCRSIPELSNLPLSNVLPMTLSCAAMSPVSDQASIKSGRAPPVENRTYRKCSTRTSREHNRKALPFSAVGTCVRQRGFGSDGKGALQHGLEGRRQPGRLEEEFAGLRHHIEDDRRQRRQRERRRQEDEVRSRRPKSGESSQSS